MDVYDRFHSQLFALVHGAAKDGVHADLLIADLEKMKFWLLMTQFKNATNEVENEDKSIQ